MSKTSASLAKVAGEAVLRACWRQWQVLQGEALPVRSIIDPEALVVASLCLRDQERRLRDLLAWWAAVRGTQLLSVQRLQTVTREFPSAMLHDGIDWFAELALQAKDRRWKDLAVGRSKAGLARPGKGRSKVELLHPATLMLRLRAGFGVGAKADLVAFLMGASARRGETELFATATAISAAIAYSRPSVARASAELVLAGFIEASADKPPLHRLEPVPWASVLRLGDPIPAWRFWSQMYAFLLAVIEWAQEREQGRAAPVVAASRARDLVERFGSVLAWNGMRLPDARVHTGERYLGPFEQLVDQVVDKTNAYV